LCGYADGQGARRDVSDYYGVGAHDSTASYLNRSENLGSGPDAHSIINHGDGIESASIQIADSDALPDLNVVSNPGFGVDNYAAEMFYPKSATY
jgi:hypothetical protein